MTSAMDIYRSAKLLVDRHGNDATIHVKIIDDAADAPKKSGTYKKRRAN